MSYVRPSRIDLCEDFFVRVSKSLNEHNAQMSACKLGSPKGKPASILSLSPQKSPSTTSRSTYVSPRSWRGDEPISSPLEYWFPFLSSGESPCRPATAVTSRQETVPTKYRKSSLARSSCSPSMYTKAGTAVLGGPRLPNNKQLPRWKRREDLPWNPPTYIPQLTPGALPHYELESDILRTPRNIARCWKSTSATPRRLPKTDYK